ncbi:MAG TPA: 16S rRNA (guanine(966)-N(2))-methyltransferase RsmD [Eggerthellaceae bacterium]|nr:16S rRNA (guanine(966)-N(2))-methyltransferase RsmD [Eggerthellaceae bacterium]
MRIVAGEFRGRTIAAPTGTNTRPTSDRVREALFSSLYSLRGGFEGACVLDAFAGSGALGLEALSRGAESAVFYERDARAAETVRRNVAACGIDRKRACVVARDVASCATQRVQKPFDLVFLDPPYAASPDEVIGLVQDLQMSGAIAPDAIIAYEHAQGSSQLVCETAEGRGYSVVSCKKYGKTAVVTLVHEN